MLEFFLYISEDGELTNEKVVSKNFSSLTPGRWLVQMKKANRRSHSQNAYYWGVVVPLVFDGLRDAGYNEITEKEQAHRIMKALFLKKNISGLSYVQSTTELNKEDFGIYLDSIFQWAAEYLSINIPSPNEQLKAV